MVTFETLIQALERIPLYVDETTPTFQEGKKHLQECSILIQSAFGNTNDESERQQVSFILALLSQVKNDLEKAEMTIGQITPSVNNYISEQRS